MWHNLFPFLPHSFRTGWHNIMKSQITPMPLISKVTDSQLLCQRTSTQVFSGSWAQARDLVPGGNPWTEHLAGKSTHQYMAQTLCLESPPERKRWIEEWRSCDKTWLLPPRFDYWDVKAEDEWVCLALCPLLFLAVLKWLRGHPSAAISPLTDLHICFAHTRHVLRSLKVQLN